MTFAGFRILTPLAFASMFAASISAASARAITIVSEPTNDEILERLLGPSAVLQNISLQRTGDDAAFGLFAAGGFGLTDGVVLSTGAVSDIPGENQKDGYDPDLSTNLSGKDDIFLTIAFDVHPQALNAELFFNFVFASEEFVEYGGSTYNDALSLSLNGTNLAFLSDMTEVTINNLVESPSGPFHPDYISNAAGAGTEMRFDGFTTVETFVAPLLANSTNELILRIRDQGDAWFDSAVFIEAGSLGTIRPEVNSVDTPGGAAAAGIGFGLIALGTLRRRRRGTD